MCSAGPRLPGRGRGTRSGSDRNEGFEPRNKNNQLRGPRRPWAATVCSPLGSHRARLFSGQDLWSSDPSPLTKTTWRQDCSGRGGAQARGRGGRQPRSGRWALGPALGPAVPTLGPGAASGKTRRGVGRASAGRTVSAWTPCETLSAVTRASAFALPRAGLRGGWFLVRTAWDTVVTLPLS